VTYERIAMGTFECNNRSGAIEIHRSHSEVTEQLAKAGPREVCESEG
jgi:hypothetical protein